MSDTSHGSAARPLFGLFGGTFDPVHRGHIEPVVELVTRAGLHGVTYIPAAVPPHRDQPLAGAIHRLAMVRLAIADYDGFETSDIELRREGPSYTFDTVQSLDESFPARRHALILGLDALTGFDRWHRWQELLQRIPLLVMTRPGFGPPEPVPDWLSLALADNDNCHDPSPGRVYLFDIDPVPVSATRVRAGLAAGEDMGPFLLPAVNDYILEHQLYEKD